MSRIETMQLLAAIMAEVHAVRPVFEERYVDDQRMLRKLMGAIRQGSPSHHDHNVTTLVAFGGSRARSRRHIIAQVLGTRKAFMELRDNSILPN